MWFMKFMFIYLLPLYDKTIYIRDLYNDVTQTTTGLRPFKVCKTIISFSWPMCHVSFLDKPLIFRPWECRALQTSAHTLDKPLFPQWVISHEDHYRRVWMGVPEYQLSAKFLPKYQLSAKNLAKYQLSVKIRDYQLTLEGIGGWGSKLPLPLNFFGFKFLFFNRFPKALVQLFFVR